MAFFLRPARGLLPTAKYRERPRLLRISAYAFTVAHGRRCWCALVSVVVLRWFLWVMGWADFAEGLQVGLSACRWAILSDMEDVVFVSERAVGKRKRQQDDDDAERKRVQLKEESSSDDSSGSDSDSTSSSSSDSDSDDEPESKVENAMSAIRVSTEPQATQLQNSPTSRINDETQAYKHNSLIVASSSKTRSKMFMMALRTYVGELELALGEHLPRKLCVGLKNDATYSRMKARVMKLEMAVRRDMEEDDPVR